MRGFSDELGENDGLSAFVDLGEVSHEEAKVLFECEVKA